MVPSLKLKSSDCKESHQFFDSIQSNLAQGINNIRPQGRFPCVHVNSREFYAKFIGETFPGKSTQIDKSRVIEN